MWGRFNNQPECQTLNIEKSWGNKTEDTSRMQRCGKNKTKISMDLCFWEIILHFLLSQCSTVPVVELGNMLMSSSVRDGCKANLWDFSSHGGNDLVSSGHGWCNFTALLLVFPCVCVCLSIYPCLLRAGDLKQACSTELRVIKEMIYFFLRISSSLISTFNNVAWGHVSSPTYHYFLLPPRSATHDNVCCK